MANPFALPGVKPAHVDPHLNDSYTFERFIEGDCNRLARSASWAIAQNPGGTSFNPFLIYGGVGLGKTHLIQAIGNYSLANGHAKTVRYVSSEMFTAEFVQSIQSNRIAEFSQFYRGVDILIVDDVQFFGGKEKTQEEFFHIFNELHQLGKQLVLSADRPPKDIAGIEERLLSRFSWGLAADVQPPDFETRVAILNRRAKDDGTRVKHEVIEYIATHVKSNIRELEGALIRLQAHAALTGREIDQELARDVLRDLIKESSAGAHDRRDPVGRLRVPRHPRGPGAREDAQARGRAGAPGGDVLLQGDHEPQPQDHRAALRRARPLDGDPRRAVGREPGGHRPSFREMVTAVRKKMELQQR